MVPRARERLPWVSPKRELHRPLTVIAATIALVTSPVAQASNENPFEYNGIYSDPSGSGDNFPVR
jgi:hypothetical protein